MTQAQDFDIVGSYNNQRVKSIDAERTVNMFQYNDTLGKKPKSLINTSGLINTGLEFGSATKGFRAQYTFLGDEYLVVDDLVYLISSTGSQSLLGTLENTDEGYVGIDANTFQVIFVDGVDGYIWDTTAQTFTKITDSSFPSQPIDVCALDGFFVVAQGNTPNFYLSSLNQGMVWGPASNEVTTNIGALPDQLIVGISNIGGPATTVNYQTGIPVFLQIGAGGSLAGSGLDTTSTYYTIFIDSTHIKLATSYENAIAGTAITITSDITPIIYVVSQGQLQEGAITTHPGNIVSCRTLHRRLFLFSNFFTEVWENQGDGFNLPFRRNNSLLMEYGTAAIGSVSVSFDLMIFLSESRDGLGSVMMVTGTGPVPISTRALDFQLAQYAAAQQISDCRGFLIKENGLIFYRMNFTEANHTFVYDVTLSDPSSEATMLWHEEEVLNGDRHPAQTHAYFNGKNYVGHYALPILYEVSSSTYTNDGELIRRMRIVRPQVPPGYQRIRIDRLQIDLLQGMIEALQPETVEQNILTENNFRLATEDGIELITEEGVIIDAPQQLYVFLSISRDGGQSYGYTIKSPMGHVGQRSFRTLWRKLGTIPRGQGFVCKFEFFDAVPFIILGGAWAIEIMPE
jgi:hypothetical protein